MSAVLRRTLVVLLGVPLAWLAWLQAGQTAARSRPVPAAPDFAGDALAAVAAIQRVGPDGNLLSPGAKERAAAREALRRQPLNAAALWLLQPAPDSAGAGGEEALRLAERITRRDPPTELVLARRAAIAGDDRIAMVHVDHLLATSGEAAAGFADQLAAGLGDPAVRANLVPFRKRAWFAAVLARGSMGRAAPQAVAGLIVEAGLRRDEVDAHLPRLLNRLVEGGDFAAAAALARKLGWSGESAVTGFGFDPAATDPGFGPLNWAFPTGGGVTPEQVAGPVLTFRVEPGHGGPALRRATGLPAGAYDLAMEASLPDGAEGAAMSWAMACSRQGAWREAWSQRLPADRVRRLYRMRVVIAADCPVQSWTLRISAFDSAGPALFEISRLSLQ